MLTSIVDALEILVSEVSAAWATAEVGLAASDAEVAVLEVLAPDVDCGGNIVAKSKKHKRV